MKYIRPQADVEAGIKPSSSVFFALSVVEEFIATLVNLSKRFSEK